MRDLLQNRGFIDHAGGLSAVVVRFSRSRKRYERQELLVEAAALAQAQQSHPETS